MALKFSYYCVISGFYRGVNEVFVLLECYGALNYSYRIFGTAFGSHLQRSTSHCLNPDDGKYVLSRNVANYP
jgi:hypothetical protein